MAVRNVGILWGGQSNQAGATLTDNGGVGAKFTSAFTGATEPFRLNVNGGGSCLPLLLDLGLARGVRYLILNGAIGGASVRSFTGSVGATITGSPTDPAIYSTMGSSGLTGGTGVICNEGDPDFDPFTFLSRLRAAKATYPQVTEWIGAFANAESEVATTSTNYRLGLESIARHMFTSGCSAVFLGLSASGGNSQAQMDVLNAARASALATLTGEGRLAYSGANLYTRFGMNPPVYPEKTAPATRVHLTLEGQRVQAELWNSAFSAAGW